MIFVSQPVLLVEDDDGDQLLIRQALRALRPSIEIDTVSTLAAARDYLSAEGKYLAAPRPRCIVLDLNLPDGRGESLLDWLAISETLCDLPVITLSEQPVAPNWPNLVGVLIKPSKLAGYEALSSALSGLVMAAVDGPLHRNDNFGLDEKPQG